MFGINVIEAVFAVSLLADALRTSVPSLWFAVLPESARRSTEDGGRTGDGERRCVTPPLHTGEELQTPPVRLRYRSDRGGDHVGADPCGGWQDAFVDCGGGGWGWARRMDPPRPWPFFAFSDPWGPAPPVVGTFPESMTSPGIRTFAVRL